MTRLSALRQTLAGTALFAFASFPINAAQAADGIIRHVDPANHFPIAQAVEVPAGAVTVYVSGTSAPVIDKSAPPSTIAAYGDTETQTRGALQEIADELGKMGLGLGDVVQMHVYLVADPKLGKIDFAGMMKAYSQFFGTTRQPNLPARSAFEVAHLGNPGWLVEIEVTAARPPQP